MSDASWKSWERRVARWFGGARRGPLVRDAKGAKSDIECEGWSPEVKLLAKVSYSHLLGAALQAETNAEEGKIPVAIVKKKQARDRDALVVFRAETFRSWFLAKFGDENE